MSSSSVMVIGLLFRANSSKSHVWHLSCNSHRWWNSLPVPQVSSINAGQVLLTNGSQPPCLPPWQGNSPTGNFLREFSQNQHQDAIGPWQPGYGASTTHDHPVRVDDQSLCAALRQSNAVSQNAKQAIRKSGTWPVIDARRVKGMGGCNHRVETRPFQEHGAAKCGLGPQHDGT